MPYICFKGHKGVKGEAGEPGKQGHKVKKPVHLMQKSLLVEPQPFQTGGEY